MIFCLETFLRMCSWVTVTSFTVFSFISLLVLLLALLAYCIYINMYVCGGLYLQQPVQPHLVGLHLLLRRLVSLELAQDVAGVAVRLVLGHLGLLLHPEEQLVRVSLEILQPEEPTLHSDRTGTLTPPLAPPGVPGDWCWTWCFLEASSWLLLRWLLSFSLPLALRRLWTLSRMLQEVIRTLVNSPWSDHAAWLSAEVFPYCLAA